MRQAWTDTVARAWRKKAQCRQQCKVSLLVTYKHKWVISIFYLDLLFHLEICSIHSINVVTMTMQSWKQRLITGGPQLQMWENFWKSLLCYIFLHFLGCRASSFHAVALKSLSPPAASSSDSVGNIPALDGKTQSLRHVPSLPRHPQQKARPPQLAPEGRQHWGGGVVKEEFHNLVSLYAESLVLKK